MGDIQDRAALLSFSIQSVTLHKTVENKPDVFAFLLFLSSTGSSLLAKYRPVACCCYGPYNRDSKAAA